MVPQSDVQAVDQLVEYGLTRLQAKVYVSVYLLGKVPVKKIVEKCRMHRAQVYLVIKELEKIGAVVPIISSRPARYHAVPPEEVLKILLVPHLDRLARLGDAKMKILQCLEEQKHLVSLDEQFDNGLEVLRGKQVLMKMQEMMNRASKEILYEYQSYRYGVHSGTVSAFNRAVERGVRARGIVNLSKEDLGPLKHMKKHQRIKRRHNEDIYSLMVIADRQEMLFGTAPWPLPDEEFLYTRDPALIQHSVIRFEKLFEKSTPIEERIQTLITTTTAAAALHSRVS